MSKIAIITGASRGLGKSMALNLADKGRDIILTYRSQQEPAQAVVREIEQKGRKAVALRLDVQRADSFDEFAARVRQALSETFQRDNYDILINNAGTGLFASFMETREDDFMQMMNEHIKAPFFLSQKLLPLMQDGGRVLNVSSGLTRVSYPGFAAYSIMKMAVEALTLYMARELGPRGITVNTLAPGAIATDFAGGAVRDTPGLNDEFARMTALGRVGIAQDIGGAVAALLEDGAGWVNAQRIEISGGQNI
ncbi:Short-chain dehydrogenase/reductase SDR (plasmid) [Sodalis praecaptivus]|uniref:Short-chain dehydrogenase/reductase SDR n=1 Tax=Sodalis praecaptivus TaxID=1239307 RepID=W0HZ68_9GAMM|nr:SDR family oxidoreductase [Sodalis praecaptivus]AHF79146.1 Short-chain dehydrogenase/reductase SDR [Sodalis praecaptivus]